MFEPIADRGVRSYAAEIREMLRGGAGAPIVRRDHSWRIGNALRLLWAIFLTQDTWPKPVFEVARWEYRRVGSIDSECIYSHSGGFVLFAKLAPGESSKHFIRSLRRKDWKSARVVAVATPEELCNGKAWVRCFVVDSPNVEPNDPQKKEIAFLSSNSKAYGKTAFNKRVADVAPDALWLVYDGDSESAADSEWMNSPDGAQTPDALLNARTSEAARHVDARVKQIKEWRTITLWVVIGFLFIAATVLAAGLVPVGTFNLVLTWLGNVLGPIAVYLGLTLFSRSVGARIISWRWLKEDRMKKKDWAGGTLRCVAAGGMLGGVSAIGKQCWPPVFAKVWGNNQEAINDREKPIP